MSTWSTTPIPGLSLAAGGLLALADLNTVAQRTVITGGSSWLDSFVLAPGLHYQQAIGFLDQRPAPGPAVAVESGEQGAEARHIVTNTAVLDALKKLCSDAGSPDVLTLHVGSVRLDVGRQQIDKLARSLSGLVNRQSTSSTPQLQALDLDWLSHLLYLASPLLTVAALTFILLLRDWWALAFILALMLSRVLNIWSIKQRSRPEVDPLPSSPAPNDGPTEYSLDLGAGRVAVLRGLRSDLHAVTSQVWLRTKTNLDGYLEAAAKLLVYMVAALSGNLTQAGAIVLMALLLLSAGLLGLSNAHAKQLQMNGRIARLQLPEEASRSARFAHAIQPSPRRAHEDHSIPSTNGH